MSSLETSGRVSAARLLVSAMNTERGLTVAPDAPENLSPTVMGELGNPATGGAANAAAYDRDGKRL
mgnify:CR=1 FL=1